MTGLCLNNFTLAGMIGVEYRRQDLGRPGTVEETEHVGDCLAGRFYDRPFCVPALWNFDCVRADGGVPDLLWVRACQGTQRGGADADVRLGREQGQKYSDHLRAHRHADRALAGGGDYTGRCELFVPAHKALRVFCVRVSAQLPGVRSHGHFAGDGGDHGSDLHGHRFRHEDEPGDHRGRGDLRRLFRRPLFAGFHQRAAGVRADGHELAAILRILS